MTAAALPYGFSIGTTALKYCYNGPEVWRDNDRHRRAYYNQIMIVEIMIAEGMHVIGIGLLRCLKVDRSEGNDQ